MKTLGSVILIWLCFAPVKAQQIMEKTIGFNGKNRLTLNIQISDSIDIQTWAKNEVYIYSSVNINENKDNNAYETKIDESGSTLKIDAGFKKDYFKGKKNCCNESVIYWKIIIPEKTAFGLETINGDVTIKGSTGEMHVKSISGFIDLSLPADRKADLELSTISGTIYSNQNLSFEKKKATGLPVKISDRMNQGGPLVKLETISGDIFFRKPE